MAKRKVITKRASYKEAVMWIAFNDNPGSFDDQEIIEGYISTLLVADIFGAEASEVAKDIKKIRDN